jgi:hypothetical protein
MAKAVAPLRARGVPDFVCHYHFPGNCSCVALPPASMQSLAL